ncbi:MAG: glycogen synthase [Dehalococcoidia bacterium]|nr:glycogen synthase [Dehalococcoidia bacterium]
MKILFAAAEAVPLAKVGGMADVVGSLPAALSRLGEDVRLIMPGYGIISRDKFPAETEIESIPVEAMGRKDNIRLKKTKINGKITVYLVENDHYFGQPSVYTDNWDLPRFLFFSMAVVETLKVLDWRPDLVHCHDWHTSIIPLLIKKSGLDAATVFTIHNLAYQGQFDRDFLASSGLEKIWPVSDNYPRLTLMNQGILNADMVSTVSENYAREILTDEFGEGLAPLLRSRQDSLVGIVNGIDGGEYDPGNDPYLPRNYTSSSPRDKASSKAALQLKVNLPQKPGVPVIGMVSRLDEQKGLDLLEKAAGHVLDSADIQLVILGKGREEYHKFVNRLAEKYRDKVAVSIGFNNPLAHLIYGGSDIFLMPSRFEPCGLGQLIAMRYGTVPLVRRTGGLADTVLPLSADLASGHGFVFQEYRPEALTTVLQGAVKAYETQKPAWEALVRRLMSLDFSWDASAKKYQSLYARALKKKTGK